MKITIEHDQPPVGGISQSSPAADASDELASDGGRAPSFSGTHGLTLAPSAVDSSAENSGGAPSEELLAAIAAAGSSSPSSISSTGSTGSPDALSGGAAPQA
jgi:hypothetical protein